MFYLMKFSAYILIFFAQHFFFKLFRNRNSGKLDKLIERLPSFPAVFCKWLCLLLKEKKKIASRKNTGQWFATYSLDSYCKGTLGGLVWAGFFFPPIQWWKCTDYCNKTYEMKAFFFSLYRAPSLYCKLGGKIACVNSGDEFRAGGIF